MFLSNADFSFLSGLYIRYLRDKSSVDQSWASFFDELGDDERDVIAEMRQSLVTPESGGEAKISQSLRAMLLIRAYRVRGHLLAKTDPLGLEKPIANPELDISHYGFTEADLGLNLFLDGALGFQTATLGQIVERLKAIYCGPVGVEYMHIQNPARKDWIQDRIEAGAHLAPLDRAGKKELLGRLIAAEGFEKFLAVKFPAAKKFGLDGAESFVPLLESILRRGGELGVREVVLGMAHRGRLNTLSNVFLKPFRAIFSEFQGTPSNPDEVQGSGDVKYHLGTSSDREIGGATLHLSLSPNPSHLEAVNPVVMGRARAKQAQLGDESRTQVMPILVHGDAAMPGQGVIAECLTMAELQGYRVGGVVHVVLNNQIGFTTSPAYGRSGPYATDIAKTVQAPIFHVNGDDPEAVVRVAALALDYRQIFGQDVVIDLVCFRRFGHSEADEPSFTQPVMYEAIRRQPSTPTLYAKRLVEEGSLGQDEVERMIELYHSELDREFAAAATYRPDKADWLEGKWVGLSSAPQDDWQGDTGVARQTLIAAGQALTKAPDGFSTHPKVLKQMLAKAEMLKSGKGIDWATAEGLAFASLVNEGIPVRLSGEDSGRGTFGQRHAAIYDQRNGEKYIPLQHVAAGQARFEAHDSPLSEYAVLGFEYGYSLAEPHSLVLWEAQFGDFANGAQIIIDQFIAAAESKWLRMSGLTMLLPHGLEGQGPEHSSARLERYLQLCAEDNMQVCNITTPANYFHALRRQVHRPFRKPLVLMTPKSLLRHKAAISDLSEFEPGTGFQRVIGDKAASGKVRRVILCSGKVYYDLAERRPDDVALVRLEQLYPFPEQELAAELARYPDAEIVWCQEEPENMGAWQFVDRKLETISGRRPRYVGRPAAAAPATGYAKVHQAEQARLVNEALS